MKKIALFVTILLLGINMSAQTNNFISEDGNIYWQKIYESSIDVKSLLTNSGKFSDLNEVNGIISARMIPARIDLNGRSTMEVPIFIRDYDMSCFVRIQQKEGRYRVTADEFKFYDRYEKDHPGIDLEFWYIKRDGSLKPSFEKTAAPVLNDALMDIFKPKENLDNNW